METKVQETAKTPANFLQLVWRNAIAIEAVDVLFNVFHLGSPTFLVKNETDTEGPSSSAFALWAGPVAALVSEKSKKIWTRVEVRSNELASNVYLTFPIPKTPASENTKQKFETLQHQMFSNFMLNWIDQEVTLVCESVAEGIALSALLRDFFMGNIEVGQIAALWREMSDDILAENANLSALGRRSHSQKHVKTERLLKFLPLTYHFYGRLCSE